jgi:hypothetical protein
MVYFHQWALTTLPEDRFSTVPAGNAPRVTPHCPKCARLASARSQSAVWQHTACFQLVMGFQRSLQSTSCSMCSKRLTVGAGGPQALFMYQMLFSLTLCCIAQRAVTRIPTPFSITNDSKRPEITFLKSQLKLDSQHVQYGHYVKVTNELLSARWQRLVPATGKCNPRSSDASHTSIHHRSIHITELVWQLSSAVQYSRHLRRGAADQSTLDFTNTLS